MNDDPQPIKFELRTLPDSSDETLIAELHRVAAIVPEGVLTRALFRQHGRSARRIYNRFGGWHEALVAAGLSHRSSNVTVVQGSHPSRNMSDEDVLNALRSLASQLNTTELTVTQVESHLLFSRVTLAKRWGSSQAAFKAAGLNTSHLGRRHTAEDCHNNILVVWTHYGRQPKYTDMALPPSTVGGRAYTLRFGTWNKALAAFVEKVNSEPQERLEGDPPVLFHDQAQPAASGSSPVHQEDVRTIPLGLRFRVLNRDRFKCVLCGDNPARNPDCRLHVDHILPWSKGGKTRENNLRALCESCNVGRGNRYLE
jgi:hypothetical protein